MLIHVHVTSSSYCCYFEEKHFKLFAKKFLLALDFILKNVVLPLMLPIGLP